MAKLQYRSLSNRTVDGLSAEDWDVIYWDRELKGFGVRVYPSGARVYLVQSRGPDGSRRVTVSRHGVISADQARRRAVAIIARIKAGAGAAAGARADTGTTVAELAERYLREHVELRCKPVTAKGYRQVIDKHILPVLGEAPIATLRREDVADLHFRLRRTPTAANRAVADLSRMLNRAEAWDLLPAGGNPCRGMAKYRTRRHERFLTEKEFRRLGETLDAMEVEGRLPVHAAAALRLLMLTGCRRGEIVGLRWGGRASGPERDPAAR